MGISAADLNDDPHSLLAELREAGPVARLELAPGMHGWLITRYEDVRRALTDPRFAKGPLSMRPGSSEPASPMSAHMLNADPPEHTRLRKLVSASFTARRMEGMRERVQEITDELIDGFAGRSEVDLIDDFAFPLPFQVICELIGVPMVDRDKFRRWSNILLSGAANGGSPEAQEAVLGMAAYIADLIQLKRTDPDDALLSGLIQSSDAGDRLNEDELSSLVFLLLVAGHETTVNLIGNAMWLLLTRPDEAERLRRDPSAVPAAVEEVLRYESPVKNATFRLAVEDVQLGDAVIPQGELVIISLMAANRDAAGFDGPDELRLDRVEGQHLAFGHGLHYCLGAPLARLEGQIAIGTLLQRLPRMRLAGSAEQLTWRPSVILRGLDHLPVELA